MSQVHEADFLDWAPVHKILLKFLNASSTVFPDSLSFCSEISLETMGATSQQYNQLLSPQHAY